MELYKIESNNMARIAEQDLGKEAELEERLIRTEAALIGGASVFYIGRQGTTSSDGIFDILGVDERGNVVVIELKRDKGPRKVVTQALEYASELRNAEYHHLNERYEAFLREEQEYEEEGVVSLEEAHAEHFELDEPLSPREFNDRQRLILVAGDFDNDKLLAMADFLREHKIDVIVVEYDTYRDEDTGMELLTTDAIRRPLSEEPSTGSGAVGGSQKWKEDGRWWHTEERSNKNTGELLEQVVDELEEIEQLNDPNWSQKYYIAFDDEHGDRRFTISSKKTLFKIRLRETTNSQEQHTEIANRLGIPEGEVTNTTSSRGDVRLQIRCRPGYDIDPKDIRSEVERILFDSAA